MKFLITLLKKNWFFITIINLLIITYLSLRPETNISSNNYSDKFYHFVAYFFLSIIPFIALPKKFRLIIIFFISYGALIEIIQPYFNRQSDFIDFIFNIFGTLVSYIFYKYIFFFNHLTQNNE